jgi:hypothetical protein
MSRITLSYGVFQKFSEFYPQRHGFVIAQPWQAGRNRPLDQTVADAKMKCPLSYAQSGSLSERLSRLNRFAFLGLDDSLW